VVDAGRLIGIAHWNRLTWADPESTVGEAMDAPISLAETDAVELAASLAAALAGSPVPVIDEDGRLTGMLDGAWTGGFRNSPR
jgi:Mg/Co/Ni transporter MgtE